MLYMAKKKSTEQRKDDRKGDRHKMPARLLRMRDSMWDALDALAERLGTDATHEMRNAVRERLEKFGLWPPASRKPDA